MRAAPATFGISITSCSTSRTSALIRLSGSNSTHRTRTKKARNWAKMERVGNEQRTRKRTVLFIEASEREVYRSSYNNNNNSNNNNNNTNNNNNYDDDDKGRVKRENSKRNGVQTSKVDRLSQAERNKRNYEYAPASRVERGNKARSDFDYFGSEEEEEESNGNKNNNKSNRPRLFPRELDKFLVAGAFVVGIGAGVIFDTAVDLEPSNVASREILDRRTPSSEVCMANGASAMVFDQRVFLSLNPFNVYVAQPEVKPGCVLRRSNWSVLERENVVSTAQENDCKRNLNTFAYVGDLKKSPEVSCVYHSEEAENQFMQDPSKAVLGDGVRGSRANKGSSNKEFR